MVHQFNLLIVEDDNQTITQWQAKIEEFNAENDSDHKFEFIPAKSLTEAKNNIEKFEIDAAVIDLNLANNTDNHTNNDGNKIVSELILSELAVVCVLSGESNVKEKVDLPETGIINIFTKGDNGIQASFDWIKSHIEMMRQIRLAKLAIKKEMVALFTKSIWPRWSNWTKEGNNSEINKSLIRHLTAHVYGTFSTQIGEKAHPEEWYFIPSIDNNIRTGDLFRDATGKVEILITPRCDISNNKASNHLLANCVDYSKKWDDLMNTRNGISNDANSKAISEKEQNKAYDSLIKLTRHDGNKNAYHFLPKVSINKDLTLGPFLIDFNNIRSIPNNQSFADELKKTKFATVTPEFLPSIVERLGSYFSRIGTPDYSHTD